MEEFVFELFQFVEGLLQVGVFVVVSFAVSLCSATLLA